MQSQDMFLPEHFRSVTVSEDDIGYYQRRAEAELERAQQATRPEVVRAHFQLANAYLERIASAEPARRAQHA